LELHDPVPDLIEQHYGEAEGTSVSDLATRWPDRNFPGGETPDAVAERALRMLNLLTEQHEGEPVLAVSHGAYIRRLVATLTQRPYHDVPGINNTSLTTFRRDAQGNWRVILINDTEPHIALPPTPFTLLGDVQDGTQSGICTID